MEMTRDQFIDRLKVKLDECFSGDQGGFQVSETDINDVQDLMLTTCDDAISEIGGRNPNEL